VLLIFSVISATNFHLTRAYTIHCLKRLSAQVSFHSFKILSFILINLHTKHSTPTCHYLCFDLPVHIWRSHSFRATVSTVFMMSLTNTTQVQTHALCVVLSLMGEKHNNRKTESNCMCNHKFDHWETTCQILAQVWHLTSDCVTKPRSHRPVGIEQTADQRTEQSSFCVMTVSGDQRAGQSNRRHDGICWSAGLTQQ